MYGAILGDIIGQPYEFDPEGRAKSLPADFPLFGKKPHFTDDSVMTIAICDGILSEGLDAGEEKMKSAMIKSCHSWGKKYPHAGGGNFGTWIYQKKTKPYGSFGNGSAMRVSSVGWLFDTMERTRQVARWSAEITHNHPEGVKGAQSVASAIFLARTGSTKEKIKSYIEAEFGYDLSMTCDEIRPAYVFDVSCQGTVTQAMCAFLEGSSFENTVRTAVSLGGDCDTLTAIASSMAEAYFGIPQDLQKKCLELTATDMHRVMKKFDACRKSRVER